MPQPAPFARRLVCAALLFTPLLLTACDALMGKEVARLPINTVSTPAQEVVKEATLPLKKAEKVALWSEMDLSFQGESPVRFQVQVLRDGQPVEQLTLDPTEKNISVKEVKTDVNGSVNWSFTGKNGELTIPETGTYTFKARLVASPNPALQVRKAELVLRK